MRRIFSLLSNKLSPEELATPIREYMIPVQTAILQDQTCSELLRLLPDNAKDPNCHYYFYTVDEQDRLTGVLSARQIVFAPADVAVKHIAFTHVIRIEETAPLEACLKLMSQHELLAIPITDKHKRLLGVFDLRNNHPNTHNPQELFQLLGFHLENAQTKSALGEFRCRMPWLISNIISGLGCAIIAHQFHLLLDEIVIISMFIPLVLTLGESIAIQSMALSLEFLNLGSIPWRRVYRRLRAEVATAGLMALATSILIGFAYVMVFDNYAPLGTIALSITLSMLLTTQLGTIIPVILHYLRLDPKVAAGPIVLMITDLSVTCIYLGLSSYMLLN